jgi:hypothetical protein
MIAVAAALCAALTLGACGSSHATSNASSDNNGVYVSLNGVYYQLQISRELNQYSAEDHGYLMGLAANPPSPQQIWYGVFLRAVNDSHQSHVTAASFDIRDTQGNVYYPVALNPVTNGYVWTAQMLQPLGTEPAPDTTASFGPTQGGLVLFKLNNSVYANRPLTLDIHSGSSTATISLNL